MKNFVVVLLMAAFAIRAEGQEQLSGFEGSGVLRSQLRGIRAEVLRRNRARLVVSKNGDLSGARALMLPGGEVAASADEAVSSMMAAEPKARAELIMDAYRATRASMGEGVDRAPVLPGGAAETEKGYLKADETLLQAWVDGELTVGDATEGVAESVGRMFSIARDAGDSVVLEQRLEAETVAALTQAWVVTLQAEAEPEMQEVFFKLADSGVVDTTTVQQSIGADGERVRTLATVNNLLPAPVDVNDPFVSKVVPGESPLGQAEYFRLLGSDSGRSQENTAVRFKELAWFGAVFNTSSVAGSSHDPSKISLSGSRVQGAGQTQFFGNDRTETLDLNLAFDAQNRRLFGEDIHGQFYLEGNNFNEMSEFRFDDLFFRGWDKGNWSLQAGKADSLFEGDSNLQPLGLNSQNVLTGSPVYREGKATNNRVQLKLSYNSGPDSLHVAIEDPMRDQWKVAGVQELTRWPALTTKLKTSGEILPGRVLTLQLSGLIRSIDGETASLKEYHDLGWGGGAFASLSQEGLPTFFAGVTGGRGVGAYINGVSAAAAGNPVAGSFGSLNGLGTYVGAQCRLFEVGSDAGGYRAVMTNIGYGIAMTENSVWLAQDQTNRTVQQGIVNLVLPLSEHVMTGLEYQYAGREVFSGDNGENHQVMAIVAIQGNKKGKAAADAAKQARRGALIAEQLNTQGSRSFSAADIERRSGGDEVAAFQQAL